MGAQGNINDFWPLQYLLYSDLAFKIKFLCSEEVFLFISNGKFIVVYELKSLLKYSFGRKQKRSQQKLKEINLRFCNLIYFF